MRGEGAPWSPDATLMPDAVLGLFLVRAAGAQAQAGRPSYGDEARVTSDQMFTPESTCAMPFTCLMKICGGVAQVELLNETSFDRRRQVAVYKNDGKRGHHMQVRALAQLPYRAVCMGSSAPHAPLCLACVLVLAPDLP